MVELFGPVRLIGRAPNRPVRVRADTGCSSRRDLPLSEGISSGCRTRVVSDDMQVIHCFWL